MYAKRRRSSPRPGRRPLRAQGRRGACRESARAPLASRSCEGAPAWPSPPSPSSPRSAGLHQQPEHQGRGQGHGPVDPHPDGNLLPQAQQDCMLDVIDKMSNDQLKKLGADNATATFTAEGGNAAMQAFIDDLHGCPSDGSASTSTTTPEGGSTPDEARRRHDGRDPPPPSAEPGRGGRIRRFFTQRPPDGRRCQVRGRPVSPTARRRGLSRPPPRVPVQPPSSSAAAHRRSAPGRHPSASGGG